MAKHFRRMKYSLIQSCCVASAIIMLGMPSWAQHVGIATATPTGPLSFGAVNQRLISLADYANIDKSGNEIYITTKEVDNYSIFNYYSNLLFGYGHTNAFVERMRVNADGNVGIGVNNPAYNLDLVGRIRARWPTGVQGSGAISFTDAAASNLYTDISMSGANIGFVHSVAGHRMLYNPTTGAMALNGSYGSAGMALSSGGSTGVATWRSSNYGAIYDGARQQFEPTAYQLNTNGSSVTLNGLTIQIPSTINAKGILDYSITVTSLFCFTCGPTTLNLEMRFNGNPQIVTTHTITNGYTTTINGHALVNTYAGELSIAITKVSGPQLSIPAGAGQLSGITFIPIPNK
jgi:hypothetical protein